MTEYEKCGLYPRCQAIECGCHMNYILDYQIKEFEKQSKKNKKKKTSIVNKKVKNQNEKR